MKIIFTRLQQRRNYASKSEHFSYLPLPLLLFVLAIGILLPNSAFSANQNSKLSSTQQTRVMVTTAKYDEAADFIRQVQLDVLGFYWDLNGESEVQVCVEKVLLDDSQIETLELDQFDAALGTLTEVEVVLESTTQGTIEKMAVWGSEYMLSLNSVLKYTLPNIAQDTMRIRAMYEKEVRTNEMQQNGFTDAFLKVQEKRVVLSSGLNAFQGVGKVQIPVQASNLLAFEDAESKLNSDLKVKVCLNYRFTSTN